MGGLGVVEQGHEAEVHVELLVAVEEGEAGIVGEEFDFGFLVAAKHDNVFQDAGGGLAGDADKFETMAMEMDGVDVVALIAEADAVTLTLF